jgi:hypothetical protein
LMSSDGGRLLVPCTSADGSGEGPFLSYVAVKYLGYWADTLVCDPRVDGTSAEASVSIEAALNAVLSVVRNGTSASELFSVVDRHLGSQSLHPALCGSMGARLGLALQYSERIRADSRMQFEEGCSYSLQLAIGGHEDSTAAASAIIAVLRTGCRVLHRFPTYS